MSSLLGNLHTFRALTLVLFIFSTHLNMTMADAGFLGRSCHDLLNGFPADIPSGKDYPRNGRNFYPKAWCVLPCEAAWLWKMGKAIAKINAPNRWFFTFLSFRPYIVSIWGVWDFGFVWVFFCCLGGHFLLLLLMLSVLLCHRTEKYILQTKKRKAQ